MVTSRGRKAQGSYCHDRIQQKLLLFLLLVIIQMSTGKEPDHSFKIVIQGDGYVGKSSLIKRFVENKFPYTSTTIGADFSRKNVQENGKTLSLQLVLKISIFITARVINFNWEFEIILS